MSETARQQTVRRARQELRRLGALVADLSDEVETREGTRLAGAAAALHETSLLRDLEAVARAAAQATASLRAAAPRPERPDAALVAGQAVAAADRQTAAAWLCRLAATALLVARQVQAQALLGAEQAEQLTGAARRVSAALAAWSRDLGRLAGDDATEGLDVAALEKLQHRLARQTAAGKPQTPKTPWPLS